MNTGSTPKESDSDCGSSTAKSQNCRRGNASRRAKRKETVAVDGGPTRVDLEERETRVSTCNAEEGKGIADARDAGRGGFGRWFGQPKTMEVDKASMPGVRILRHRNYCCLRC